MRDRAAGAPIVARSKRARQQIIDNLLRRQMVRSQSELLELLAAENVEVTQPTLSRDLMELRAVKVRYGDALVYAVPGLGGDTTAKAADDPATVRQRLRQVCEEVLVSAAACGPIVVVRTPPGAANYLAAAFDASPDLGVLGTVAGDDTIFLATEAAEELAQELVELSDPGRRRSGE